MMDKCLDCKFQTTDWKMAALHEQRTGHEMDYCNEEEL